MLNHQGKSAEPPSLKSTHKFACPHCKSLSISYYAKSRSSRGWPAICPDCKALSYGAGLFSGIATVLFDGGLLPVSILLSCFYFSQKKYISAFAISICAYLLYRFISYFSADDRLWPISLKYSILIRRLTYAVLFSSTLILIIFLYMKRHG